MNVVGDVRSNLTATASLAVEGRWPKVDEALDQVAIAELSGHTISQMSRSEKMRIIGAARLPMLPGECELLLEYQDDRTLTRLVYLARRCCVHRLTAPALRRGDMDGDGQRSVYDDSQCVASR